MSKRSTVYHNDLTIDYDKVCEANRKLVKEFLQYCKSNNRSSQTILQYENWLKVFFCWNYAENEDKLFVTLKKRDFVNYFGYLRDLDVSSNRIAALKSVLSALSNEIELLYEDEYPTFKNQLRGLEPVHVTTVREKTVLSNEDLVTILNKLVEQKEYQAACYLALVCASGSRKAELIQMKVNFFVPENEVFDGYMYATPLIRAKGRGKEGKRIKKYVIKEAFKPYFDLWMEERERLGITNEYLFVSTKTKEAIPATISTANTLAAKISEVGGVEFYSHSGRHFFATMLKRKNFPDDIVVQIFSWADSSMIKVYNDISPEEYMHDFFKSLNNKEVKGE